MSPQVPALSIVIVSYNVSHFLQQTLQSVEAAIVGIEAEVWVVDNASADDSVQMVQAQFPWVRLIPNQENVGFAKANNQALRQAKGQYHLLLNPDVVLAEDTLSHCLDFMSQHPDAGGLGVRMVDGSGIYLAESKRGLPTPWVSFCKIVGLTGLLPKSELFARYYMGHLTAQEIQRVDVLSGAFMLMPKVVLDQIGLLDEAFFMYGEDVDLSYRIQLAGYQNYYSPGTTIIHYKGESTKKGSLKYVRVFYHAMAIFARKHFLKGGQSVGLDLALGLAIWLRASLSVASRIWRQVRLPLLDAGLLFVGMYLLKDYWQANHKRVPGDYPPTFMLMTVPAYILAWLGSTWLTGGYIKRPKAEAIIKGLVIGMVLISAVTNFFDDWRYSKALILLGTGWGIASMLGWRLLAQLGQYGNLRLGEHRTKRVLIVAENQEANRIKDLIDLAKVNATVVGVLNENANDGVGKLTELQKVVQVLNVQEIIFGGANISNKEIISFICNRWNRIPPAFRIVPSGSDFIIGSSDKNQPGDYYSPESSYILLQQEAQRKKRLFDLGFSLLVIMLGLIIAILRRVHLGRLYAAAFKVLWGGTWVLPSSNKINLNQADPTDAHVIKIFGLKARGLSVTQSVFCPSFVVGAQGALAHRVDALYVRDYSVWMDFHYVWLGLPQL